MSTRFIYLFCLAFFLVALHGGLQIRDSISGVTAQQEKNTKELMRWKDAYQALEPVKEEWEETYIPLGHIEDLVSLYDRFKLKDSGLDVDRKELVVDEVSQVEFNDKKLNLARICVETEGEDGLAVQGDNVSSLLEGVEDLEARKDVEMSEVSFKNRGEGNIKVILKDICFFLRE